MQGTCDGDRVSLHCAGMGQSLGVTVQCQAVREGEPLPQPHTGLTEVSMEESHSHVDIWVQGYHVSPR